MSACASSPAVHMFLELCGAHASVFTAALCLFSSATGSAGTRMSSTTTLELSISIVAMYLGFCLFQPSLSRGVSGVGDSYTIVLWSLSRRSNTRTLPSAETLAKTSGPPHAMSYTSLSCAMSCESTVSFSRSQMVHVVSKLLVPTLARLVVLQSNDVSGAQKSLFLLLFRRLRRCTPSSPMRQTRR